MFDFVAVSGSMDDRVIEYVDHLHDMFATLHDHEYPHGPVWTDINSGGNN